MNVLVKGYYYHDNLGDDLFIDAFKKLFPELNLSFTDKVKTSQIKENDVLFIGGGSFLFADPGFSAEDMELLRKKKIFYISVGAETYIHPQHLELMKMAKLIVIRNENKLADVLKINKNSIYMPDIVYSLQENLKTFKREKSVLIMPNMAVVPLWDGPHWMHTAWSYFKVEFAQFLDTLMDKGYYVRFLPLSIGKKLNDTWAATEIMTHMHHRSDTLLIKNPPRNARDTLEMIQTYESVITQRYHGIILAEMAKVPYVSIHHHDKLKRSYLNEGSFIPYYGINKQMLIDNFNQSINMQYTGILPIEANIFEELTKKVMQLIGE